MKHGVFHLGRLLRVLSRELLDAPSIAKLSRLTALRIVAESVRFWEMSAVDAAGNEYDRLVSAGPAPNWQVYANPGLEYIVYYWGEVTDSNARVAVPPGFYTYRWLTSGTRSFFRAAASSPFTEWFPFLHPPRDGWEAPARLSWFSELSQPHADQTKPSSVARRSPR